MSTSEPCAVAVEPGALLATAPADTSLEQFNATLAPYGLSLPIEPLLPALSLADLVRWNVGGRRRLRYGTVARYLRAAVLDGPDGLYQIGGPTIKRATGYGLNRAICGSALELGTLHELTFSLRPLPAAQVATLLALPNPTAACQLATQLHRAGLALSALALACEPDGTVFVLAELEESTAVVARQQASLSQSAAAYGATILSEATPWSRWEALATRHVAATVRLDLSVPRVALPELISRSTSLARRYGLDLTLWGEAGVGALHVSLHGDVKTAGILGTILHHLGHHLGGSVTTELGWSGVGGPGWPLPRQGEAFVIGRPLSAPPPTHPPQWGGGAAPPQHPLFEKLPPLPLKGEGGAKDDHPPLQAGRDPFIAAARAIVGNEFVRTEPDEVAVYNQDASIAQTTGTALAVVLPANTAEVAALVELAASHGVPIVARGAGSGLSGGAIPQAGALVLALNRLDQIQIDPEQLVAHVGAGAITAEIQRAAEAVGLVYPPDPSSQTASTIGGNLACNAGGPRCVKYGVTADYLLAVTAVLADGRVVRWGDGLAGQAPSNGLAQLLVGSEGTLAIITEATLRLTPTPQVRRTSTALFPSLEAACATVEQIMASGIVPAALELMDDGCLAAVEAYLGLGLPPDAGAMLLMLADGEPESVAIEVEAMAALARAGGATRVEVASTPAEEARLWQARRGVSIALTRIRPSRLGEDIAVPLSQIVACVRQIQQVSAEHGLPIVVFGHAGDGNLHPNILFDPRDRNEMARLWPCAEAVFAASLAVGGTLSGEHGVGTLKRGFMSQAFSPASLAALQRIKAQFDPRGLLNPGKVLP